MIPQNPGDRNANRFRRLFYNRTAKVGAVVVVGALAAFGVIHAVGSGGDRDQSTTPGTTPTATDEPCAPHSADASPTLETSRTPEFDISNGINAERYSTPEQITQAFSEVVETWYNDGANQENSHRLFRGDRRGVEPMDFANEIAASNAERYAALYFVDGWENNDALRSFVYDQMQPANAQAIYDYLLTAGDQADCIAPDPADKEPYYRSNDATYISSSSADNSIQITATYHEYGNSGSNRVGEAMTANADWPEHTSQLTTSLVVQNGNWCVSVAPR